MKFKNIQNSRQNRSKNKLVSENAVTRAHGSCSLRVMGSWYLSGQAFFLSFFLSLAFFRLLKALTDPADLMDLCSLDQIKGPVYLKLRLLYSIVFFLVKKNRLRFEDYTYSCYNDKSRIYMIELSYS